MLIAFAGLSGAGKTTIARILAQRLGAAYLRIDTIEQALRSSRVLKKMSGLPVTSSPRAWLRKISALVELS